MAGKKKSPPPRASRETPAAVAAEPPPAWLRWIVPNLPLAVAIAAALYCMNVYNAPQRFFADADAGWHIRAGDWIVANGRVPVDDPFSFQSTGRGWFAWEWLAEVVMSLVHRSLGLTGIVWIYALVIGAATWTWFRLHWKCGGNFLVACAMVSPLLAATQIHWLARPHMLSFVFVPATLLALESMPTRLRWPHVLLAAGGAALWANLHGSFVMGIAMAALYGAGSLAVSPERARAYFVVAGAMLAGTLVNPYGWNLHRHVVDYLLRPELREGIEEWQRYDFAEHQGRLQVTLMFVIAAAGAALALWQRRLEHFLVICLVLYTGFAAGRGVPVTALAALPLANAALTRLLASRRWLPRVLDLGAAFRRIDAQYHGAALAAVVTVALLAWLQTAPMAARTGYPASEYPVVAAEAVEKLPDSARLFASPVEGGYLIYRLDARRRIWLDSRSDYFGPEPYRMFHRIVSIREGWQEDMRNVAFTHALVDLRWPLGAALEKSGWRTLHRDDRFALLAK